MISNFYLGFIAPFFITAELLRMVGWKKDEFERIDEIVRKKVLVHKQKSK